MFWFAILIFTKLMIFNIIWKKEINCKSLNSNNTKYIYGIYTIIEFFLFLDYIRFGFELINQKLS